MESWLQKQWQTIKQALVKAGEYLREHKYTAIFITGVVVLAFICWAGYLHFIQGMTWVSGTGFSQYVDADGKLQRGKTLWDWLELLIIPFVLALGAWWLQRSERDSDRKLAEERRQDDQNRVKDQQQETALQDYIDKMTELLLYQEHPLRNSKPEDEVRVVARTRTLTTLRMLDPVRKGILLKFLYEAGLITLRLSKEGSVEPSIINLSGTHLREAHLREARLSGADLSGADLRGADLSGADLNGANLIGTDLNEADLTRANLTRADLNGADLNGADLNGADLHKAFLNEARLREAHLIGANLQGADLQGADLIGADLGGADLSGADLREAYLRWTTRYETHVRTLVQSGAYLSLIFFNSGTFQSMDDLGWGNLRKAILEYATMPDGKKYDPAIHIFDENGYLVNTAQEEN